MREYNGFGYIGWGANTKHWRTSRGPFLIQQYKDMMFTSIKKSLASILFSPWLGHTGRSTDQSRTGSELACAVLCRSLEMASGPFDKTEPGVAATKTDRSDGNPSTSSPRSMLEDIHRPPTKVQTGSALWKDPTCEATTDRRYDTLLPPEHS